MLNRLKKVYFWMFKDDTVDNRVMQRRTPFLFAVIMIAVVISTTQKILNYQGSTISSISGTTKILQSVSENLVWGGIFLTVIILMVTLIMFILSIKES